MAVRASGRTPETALRGQLRILSQDRGLWREKLGKLFDDELPGLRDFWEVDTNCSDSEIRDWVDGKLEVHLKVMGLRIKPPQDEQKRTTKRQEFERHFRLGFNMFSKNSINLNDRQRRGTSQKTAERDFDFACNEIERQLLAAGFVPHMPVRSYTSSAAHVTRPCGVMADLCLPGAGWPVTA